MKKLFLLVLLTILALPAFSQVLQKHNWCPSKCNLAGDELKNAELLHLQMVDKEIMSRVMSDTSIYIFPLRIGIVQQTTDSVYTTQLEVRKTIDYLNKAFVQANIQFYIAKVDLIQSESNISDLQKNFYDPYLEFSKMHDLKDTISLFLFDYDPHLCEIKDNYISCARTGGFSYILSSTTNNIVLSKFDLEDHKVIVHEFGHFFGLYHTFERQQFGKELISGEGCAATGDRVCDTPADPGTLFEVYVNYSKCEMIGNLDPETKAYYRPLIQNFMSYYKPCYLKEYSFTPMQLEVLKVASRSSLRANFRDGI